MHRSALVWINSFAILLVAAAGAVVFLRFESREKETLGSGETVPAPTGEADFRGRILLLEERLEALESRLGRPASPRAEDPASGDGSEGDPETSEKPDGTDGAGAPQSRPDAAGGPETGKDAVSGERLRELVRDVLREEEETKKRKKVSQKKGPKPKRTISQVSRELGLDYDQEHRLGELHRQLTNDLMKILFDVKEDEGLVTLKNQLKEAEYNEDLKGQLGEKLAINWTLSQNKFAATMIRTYTKMKKFLTDEQIKALDRYDLQPDKPEWPDIEKMFFPKEEKKDEGEREGE
jgi:hypothetical protein